MPCFLTRFFISLATSLFLIIGTVKGQAITVVAPSSGVPGKKIDVVLRGINTHFTSGISKAFVAGGTDIAVAALSIQDPMTAIVTLEISSTASPGFRTITINTNGEIAKIENGFEVFDAAASFRVNIQAMAVESIEISDFDFSNVEASPIFFFSNVFNDNVRRK